MIQHVFSIFNDKVFREVVSITSYIFLSLETQNTKVWNGIIKFSEQKSYIFFLLVITSVTLCCRVVFFLNIFQMSNPIKMVNISLRICVFRKVICEFQRWWILLSWLENFSSQIKVTNGFWYQFLYLWPFLFLRKGKWGYTSFVS